MLSTVRLANFRGYADLSLALAERLTVLVGDNAQGKTNLLRAVETLGLGDSRETPAGEMLRFGATTGCVEGQVASDGSSDRLLAGLSGRGLRLALNGKAVSRPRWVGRLPVLFVGPEDREQVTGPPAARRDLLDELLEQCEPEYLSALKEYRRALRQRNRALARGRESLPEEVEIWDEPLARAAGVILAHRIRALGVLAPRAAAWHCELTGGLAELGIGYRTGVERPEADEQSRFWTEALRAALRASRERELAWGATLVGPHRDDVAIHLSGRALKGTGSSGEVWSAILALTLASAEHLGRRLGRLPVLLLDDVLSALDISRRRRLLGVLGGFPQAFLTTTSRVESEEGLSVYEVHEHRLFRLGHEEVTAAAWQRRN